MTLALPYTNLKTRMNKTEAAYAELLALRRNTGEVRAFSFEPMKFRLADSTFYTPDFLVVLPECMEIHEVKGFWRSRDRVRTKVAAELYPWFRWCAVQKATAKERRAGTGTWKWEWFN